MFLCNTAFQPRRAGVVGGCARRRRRGVGSWDARRGALGHRWLRPGCLRSGARPRAVQPTTASGAAKARKTPPFPLTRIWPLRLRRSFHATRAIDVRTQKEDASRAGARRRCGARRRRGGAAAQQQRAESPAADGLGELARTPRAAPPSTTRFSPTLAQAGTRLAQPTSPVRSNPIAPWGCPLLNGGRPSQLGLALCASG